MSKSHFHRPKSNPTLQAWFQPIPQNSSRPALDAGLGSLGKWFATDRQEISQAPILGDEDEDGGFRKQ